MANRDIVAIGGPRRGRRSAALEKAGELETELNVIRDPIRRGSPLRHRANPDRIASSPQRALVPPIDVPAPVPHEAASPEARRWEQDRCRCTISI